MAEIGSLVDIIPGPALLLDLQRNRIILANAAMTEMTAFTRGEMTNQDLANLLPELMQRCSRALSFTGLEVFNDRLLTRQGYSLDVRVSFHLLNQSGSWGLAILEAQSKYENDLANDLRYEERLMDLLSLAKCSMDEDVSQSIRDALAIGQRLTGATHLSVYLVQASEPELRCYLFRGSSNPFPELLTPDAAWQATEPQVWVPGRRATNDLHRAARKDNLAFIANFPLGASPALIGLLVIAGSEGTLPDDYELLLGILATTVTGIIEHKTFQENLVTNDREIRRQLQISETFLDSSQEGLILLSPDLNIEEMNPAAEALLGYAVREVSGQSIGNIMIGPANLIPALQSAQGGIATPNLGEVRLVRRDGATFLAHISLLPYYLSDQLEGIVLLFRDLSEHEQFEARNQQLEQRALLGEVTAIFAHEVRNPINNISTGLQLMSMNLPEDDPNQDLIGRLSHECNRLNHLMQSVLTFSKPAESAPQPIDLNELLPATVERWRPRLARFNIKHEIHLTTNKAAILGDARALEQVFNNLISNAIEAMKDTGGTITINIRPAPSISSREYVEVSVIDNGPGIPEDILDRIFDPFVTSNRNGTGLGLSIAKRIVNKHKGSIDVASIPGGTVFRSIFPVSDPEEAEQT
jgi:PAS domain S-box-containing protein